MLEEYGDFWKETALRLGVPGTSLPKEATQASEIYAVLRSRASAINRICSRTSSQQQVYILYQHCRSEYDAELVWSGPHCGSVGRVLACITHDTDLQLWTIQSGTSDTIGVSASTTCHHVFSSGHQHRLLLGGPLEQFRGEFGYELVLYGLGSSEVPTALAGLEQESSWQQKACFSKPST